MFALVTKPRRVPAFGARGAGRPQGLGTPRHSVAERPLTFPPVNFVFKANTGQRIHRCSKIFLFQIKFIAPWRKKDSLNRAGGSGFSFHSENLIQETRLLWAIMRELRTPFRDCCANPSALTTTARKGNSYLPTRRTGRKRGKEVHRSCKSIYFAI